MKFLISSFTISIAYSISSSEPSRSSFSSQMPMIYYWMSEWIFIGSHLSKMASISDDQNGISFLPSCWSLYTRLTIVSGCIWRYKPKRILIKMYGSWSRQLRNSFSNSGVAFPWKKSSTKELNSTIKLSTSFTDAKMVFTLYNWNSFCRPNFH